MNILGIDLGLKKTGLAISYGPLAEPLKVIYHKNLSSLISQLSPIIKKEEIKKIILGISESQMQKQQEEFAQVLEKSFNIPIELQDETLSTKDAQMLSIEANINRKKRHKLEDAYSAALILQNYLDSTL